MKKLLCGLLVMACMATAAHAGKVADDLKGKLVQYDGKGVVPAADTAIEGKTVIAYYYSAHWCPPCRQFTPELVKFYNSASKKYPNFQLVFVSSDKSAEDMKGYMDWGKMEWPAITFDSRRSIAGVKDLSAKGIPYLVVVDADGNQLAGKAKGEDWRSPDETLEELKKILKNSGA